MTNLNFIESIIDGISELKQFDHSVLMKHDCSLPDDYFDWNNIHNYEFNYSDMILTMWNDDAQFLQIDIDTNAFFFNTAHPVQLSTGEGTIMFYSVEQEKMLLENSYEPTVYYDPCQFMSEETNFQGSTLVNIPDSVTLIHMWDIAEHMRTNYYKLRTNIPFENWQKLPVGEYFDVCSQRMNSDYEY